MNKKTGLLVLGLIFLGVFLPIQTVFAAWYDFLVGAITFIPMVTIALVLQVGVLLTATLALFSGIVLKWVLSPQFIQLSYTNPANNPFIEMGLNITQPLANMILVLVLVFIALATILRLAGHETKKLLLTFILVALLVNFSPVILGIIVDAGNIIMNFFIEEITGGDRLISQLTALKDAFAARIDWKSFKVTEQITFVLELLVFIFINIALFLNLLLWAVIFIARYVVIWLLVILSPLAFVCFILPATKRIWSLWWNHFIRWVIIGVNAVFFLYLADQFAILGPAKIQYSEGTLGGAILPAIFPLAVYWAGLIISVAKLPAEAATIRDLTKKYGKKAGLYTAHLARRGAGRVLGARGREWMERQAAARLPKPEFKGKSWGKRIATVLGYAPGYLTGAIPTYWAVRRSIGEAGLRLTEASRANISEKEKEFEGATVERMAATLADPTASYETKIAVLRKTIDQGQISGVRDRLQRTGRTDQQIDELFIEIGRAALRVHPDIFSPIRDAFPHLVRQIRKGFSASIQQQAKIHYATARAEGYSGVIEKIMDEMSPSAATKMDPSILFGPKQIPRVWQSAQKHWGGSHWAQAGGAFGRKFAEYVGQEFKKAPQNFSAAAQKYFTSSPGQSLYGT